MTKQEWDKVENALTGTYGVAILNVDGHRISFERVLVAKNRLGITTYIDGSFKGIWMSDKNEYLEQRYLKFESKFLFSKKERDKEMKVPKRYRMPGIDNKYCNYSPFWSSATEIRRHYQKTFTTIELVEVSG